MKPIDDNFSRENFILFSPQINPAASFAKGMVVNALVKSNDLAEGLIESNPGFNDSFIIYNDTSSAINIFIPNK